jgi:GNAT superfamily N-acetyltransferase
MNMSSIAAPFETVARGVRRFGISGSVARVASLGWESARDSFYLRERHIWYALDLREPRQPVALPAGFTLSRAAKGDLALLDALPTIGRTEARRRHQGGAELWLVREGDRPAAACWIFRERTPVLAARGGWLTLPAGTVCLEDSVTAAAYRGRGLSPACWSAVATQLSSENIGVMLTKIAETNTASRRAVEKAGFRPTAIMSLRRVVRRSRVDVSPCHPGNVSAFLEAALAR